MPLISIFSILPGCCPQAVMAGYGGQHMGNGVAVPHNQDLLTGPCKLMVRFLLTDLP